MVGVKTANEGLRQCWENLLIVNTTFKTKIPPLLPFCREIPSKTNSLKTCRNVGCIFVIVNSNGSSLRSWRFLLVGQARAKTSGAAAGEMGREPRHSRQSRVNERLRPISLRLSGELTYKNRQLRRLKWFMLFRYCRKGLEKSLKEELRRVQSMFLSKNPCNKGQYRIL